MQFLKEWSADDRHAIAQFFSTAPGIRFLETLRINRPKLGGDTTEKAAASSNKAGGYEQCFGNISILVGTDPNQIAKEDRLEQLDINAFSSREVTGAQQQ